MKCTIVYGDIRYSIVVVLALYTFDICPKKGTTNFFVFSFFQETLSDDDDDEISWLLETVSTDGMNKLTELVCKIWEDLFAIELTKLTQPTIIPILDSYVLV